MRILSTMLKFRKGISFSFFYLLLFASLATVAGMVLITSGSSIKSYNTITEKTVDEYNILLNIKQEAVESQMATLRLIFNTEAEDVQQELEYLDTIKTKYGYAWDELSSLAANSSLKRDFDTLAEYRKKNEAAREQVVYQSMQASNSPSAAIHLYYSLQKPAYDVYQQALETMSREMQKHVASELSHTNNMVSVSSKQVNWLLFFSFLIMVAGGLLLTKHHRQLIKVQTQLISERHELHNEITRQTLAAQEKERNELGKELHDNVNQLLTVVKLNLAMASEQKAKTHELLPKCAEYLNQAIEEIRSLSKFLVAPLANQICLRASIDELITTIRPLIPDLDITFLHDEFQENRVSQEVNVAIYRILQEQLNNIIKHADAETVSISLSVNEENLVLLVQDDGKGFDVNAIRKGVGLNNIITRAEAYKGEAVIESAPGSGCALKVIFPVSSPKKTVKYSLTSRWAALS